AVYGRERFDRFLKGYFDHFAFQSITTDQFAAYLNEHLLKEDPEKAAKVHVEEWLHGPGLPTDAPNPSAAALAKVEQQAKAVAAGTTKAADLPGKAWSAHEWVHFLTSVPADLGKDKM